MRNCSWKPEQQVSVEHLYDKSYFRVFFTLEFTNTRINYTLRHICMLEYARLAHACKGKKVWQRQEEKRRKKLKCISLYVHAINRWILKCLVNVNKVKSVRIDICIISQWEAERFIQRNNLLHLSCHHNHRQSSVVTLDESSHNFLHELQYSTKKFTDFYRFFYRKVQWIEFEHLNVTKLTTATKAFIQIR